MAADPVISNSFAQPAGEKLIMCCVATFVGASPFFWRAIRVLRETPLNLKPNESPVWRIVTVWCPRCWWKTTVEFHRDVSKEKILRWAIRQHSGCPAGAADDRSPPRTHIRIEGF
jgi:hypothetical protein